MQKVIDCVEIVLKAAGEPAQGIAPDTPLSETMDSLVLVDLAVRLEEMFSVKFKRADLADPEAWKSPGDIARLLARISLRKAG